MIMMADWCPDIIEFIISKMQNPKILRWLKDNSQDRLIREEATRKIKFVPLTNSERNLYEWAISKEDEVDSKILQDGQLN